MTIIINELLCYLIAKIDSVPTDTLTRLVSETFTGDEVDASKKLLCEHVDDSVKTGAKRGQNKKKHDLDDIVKMLVLCDRNSLPSFVALDLAKLPPVSIDCIDVSSLMRKQQLQEVEISNLKSLVQEILTVTAETSKRVEEGRLGCRRDASEAPRCLANRPATSCPLSAPSGGSASGVAGTVPVPPSDAGALGPVQACLGPSYSEVVRGEPAVTRPDGPEWYVANRRKRARAPVPRGPAGAASASQPQGTAGAQQARPAAKAIIGSRTSDSIKAVTAVKRVSVFISRLPPGTGEEAVRKYAMEQTGADAVTALKLKTKYDTYESYRLDLMNPSCDSVLDPDLWAQGLVIRRFFTSRQSSDGDTSSPGASEDSHPSGSGGRR